MTPLTLRDVHEGAAPSLWPPAPGWWLLLACLAVAVALLAWRRVRRRRRDIAVRRVFEDALARAATPSQQVAAMSELLRRAARARVPGSETLQGEAWLQRLDEGLAAPVFSAGPGRLLLDGGFRGDVPAAEVDALRVVAQERYLAWMRSA